MSEGREGDWVCSGCKNRNYAFRSFCNRCKHSRLLVDTNTPSHSKWIPRIGDWICSGCTNNNYASREKCKKCGNPKEVATMPGFAIPGAPLPTYQHYFSMAQQTMGYGLIGNGIRILQQPLPLSSNWPSSGKPNSGLSYGSNASQPPKGWRNGDWICNCGFHNYSSRAECKKCNASMPPALGLKRLASEELPHDWDNKRLNAGQNNQYLTNGQQQPYPCFEDMIGSGGVQKAGLFGTFSSQSSGAAPNYQMQMQLPHQVATPMPVGKGAKQWRDGDWMCTNCNNHNYASRSNCNRCKTLKEAIALPVSVM